MCMLYNIFDHEDISYKNVHILDETLNINSIDEVQNGEYQCAGIYQAGAPMLSQ